MMAASRDSKHLSSRQASISKHRRRDPSKHALASSSGTGKHARNIAWLAADGPGMVDPAEALLSILPAVERLPQPHRDELARVVIEALLGERLRELADAHVPSVEISGSDLGS
jgi:hypothetical protein